MYNQEFQKQQALRLLNTHLGRKPTSKVFINDDPNAAAILEMQGARIHKGRDYDVTVLPPELANDTYFNKHTLPYMMPGKEIPNIQTAVDYASSQTLNLDAELMNNPRVQEYVNKFRQQTGRYPTNTNVMDYLDNTPDYSYQQTYSYVNSNRFVDEDVPF